MNLPSFLSLAGVVASARVYDDELIGLKIDWLGLIILCLLIGAIALWIRELIKDRRARRQSSHRSD